VDDGVLTLRRHRDGPPMRLVPLNFLLNELAPQLYRFLGFFGIGSLANFAWWDRVDQRCDHRDRVRRYPRIRLDSVVLARRTWKVPPSELAELDGLDGLPALRAVRRWQHHHGLPDLVFCRKFTVPDPLVPLDPAERARKTRTLTQFPSSAERKPVLLDFTSVTSVRAWLRGLRRTSEDITFQECLPAPGSDPDSAYTREFVVETVGESHA
jgi:hypothetical protein